MNRDESAVVGHVVAVLEAWMQAETRRIHNAGRDPQRVYVSKGGARKAVEDALDRRDGYQDLIRSLRPLLERAGNSQKATGDGA